MAALRLFVAAAGLLLAGAAAAQPAPPSGPVRVYFDNDFLGPGQANIDSLLPLIRDPAVRVEGIGVVTGDAWVREETQHLLRFLEIAGRADIPVAAGAEMPLIRTQREMAAWEARYGRIPFKGAWNAPRPGRTYHPDDPALVPPLPEGAPTARATAESAAAMLIRLVHAHPGEVTVVAAGPLTNIALAIRLDPEVPRLAKEILFQGGYLDIDTRRVSGNADYATDFNLLFDPEAAHIVLTAPWRRITALGNVTDRVKVDEALAQAIGRAGTPTATYFQRYARRGQPMWDAIVTAVAADRSLVREELETRMDVEMLPGASYGTARVWKAELAPGMGEGVVHVVQAIDTDRFLGRFVAQASR